MLPLYDNIRRRRIELGMSQDELATKLGYKSRSSINKIESGINDIPQSKIVEFAKALDISPGELMGWTTPKLKALWRYATIENDKIVLKFPGLSNSLKSSIEHDKNSPLPFDISPNVVPVSSLERQKTFSFEGQESQSPLINNSNFSQLNGLMVAARELTPEQIDFLISIAESMKET